MTIGSFLMKTVFAAGMLCYGSVLFTGCTPQRGRTAGSERVDVSFTFTRQEGWATNQFAVWIEDGSGTVIKTLAVTDFTAKRGWEKRKDSLCEWVGRVDPSGLTSAELDAYSGATPQTGTVLYSWDCTDKQGKLVTPGTYVFFVEGTLRWKNHVLYRGVISTEAAGAIVKATAQYFGTSEAERAMLSDVAAEYVPL